MEPFTAFYPKIEVLRQEQNGSFCAHLRSLSRLSKKILNCLLAIICLAVIVASWNLSNKSVEKVGIMIATFFNAFLILYFTHWRNHRFDLSLDAVVKLFASGFVLANLTAVCIETVLQVISGVFFVVVLGVELVADEQQDSTYEQRLPQGAELAHCAAEHHIVTFLVFIFFMAFVEAALVEELSKYFSYFMIEHGDFIFQSTDIEDGADASEDGSSATSTQEAASPCQGAPTATGSEASAFIPRKPLSPSATASMITVAMVATATGFSCSENLGYVFGQKNALEELVVLVMRAVMPVHAICAAIQSVGVVRRDVEKDASYGIGWAVLPAVVLHGTFDFVLFAIAFFRFRNEKVPSFGSSSAYKPPVSPDDFSLSWSDIRASMIPGLIITALGFLYYASEAVSQRSRLALLDVSQPDIALSAPFI